MISAGKRNYRVVVLAGGASAERSVSLASGANVVEALEKAGHRPLLLDPSGGDLDRIDWDCFDGCFLALHGGAGEDGRIQNTLAARGVRFTGSDAAASAAAMSKLTAKRVFLHAGIATPDFVVIPQAAFLQCRLLENTHREVERLGYPLVVKPDSQGSSLGVAVAHDATELAEILPQSGSFGWPLIIERFVAGREFTVTVLGRRAIAPLEITGCKGIFDYERKYAGSANDYNPPKDLQPMTLDKLQSLASRAAAALGTAGMVRVDMILDNAGQPWVLELNTLPGMTRKSLAPKAAELIGLKMPELCDWMLREAML